MTGQILHFIRGCLLILPLLFNLAFSQSFNATLNQTATATTMMATTTTTPNYAQCPPVKRNTSCADIAKYLPKLSCGQESQNHSGIYQIWSGNSYKYVVCQFRVHGVESMQMIQRRGEYPNLPFDNFYRNWANYSEGFGNFENEFWWGLENMHQMTNEAPMDLIITLKSYSSYYGEAVVKLFNFKVGMESDGYPLSYDKIKSYSTSLVNLEYNFPPSGSRFYTYDNDISNRVQNYKGAWWFDTSNPKSYFNINGFNYHTGRYSTYSVFWRNFQSYYNLKETTMNLAPPSNKPIVRAKITDLKSCQGINQIAIGGRLPYYSKTCSCEKVYCVPYECHNWGYLNKTLSLLNGGVHVQGYEFNIDSQNEVFIGTGINLGVHNFNDLNNQTLKNLIDPFVGRGKKNQAAQDLYLSVHGAKVLDNYIFKKAEWFAEEYGYHLSKRGEAVLVALYYWCGNFVDDCTCNFKCKEEKGVLKNAIKKKSATDEDLAEALNKLLYCSICDGDSCQNNHITKALVKLIKVITDPLNNHNHHNKYNIN